MRWLIEINIFCLSSGEPTHWPKYVLAICFHTVATTMTSSPAVSTVGGIVCTLMIGTISGATHFQDGVPIPSAAQLNYQRQEIVALTHFNMVFFCWIIRIIVGVCSFVLVLCVTVRGKSNILQTLNRIPFSHAFSLYMRHVYVLYCFLLSCHTICTFKTTTND